MSGCESEEKRGNRSLYALIAGAVVSAFLATSCCLAPLLFMIFGVGMGSLSFFHLFAPYRPWFTALAVGVIGYLWIDYLRKRKKGCCSAELCRRYPLYLVIGTLLVAIFSTYPWWIDLFLGSE